MLCNMSLGVTILTEVEENLSIHPEGLNFLQHFQFGLNPQQGVYQIVQELKELNVIFKSC